MKIKLKNGIWEDEDPRELKSSFITIMYAITIMQGINLAQTRNIYLFILNLIVFTLYIIIIYTKHRHDKQGQEAKETWQTKKTRT